jgi:hypothetical protein
MPEIGNLPWLQTWRASLRQALHTTALPLDASSGGVHRQPRRPPGLELRMRELQHQPSRAQEGTAPGIRVRCCASLTRLRSGVSIVRRVSAVLCQLPGLAGAWKNDDAVIIAV